MSCAHDGIIKEEIRKQFVYPSDPDDGEWEVLSRTETCEVCGEVSRKCTKCERSFMTRVDLKIHLDKAHGILTGFDAWWERRKSYHP